MLNSFTISRVGKCQDEGYCRKNNEQSKNPRMNLRIQTSHHQLWPPQQRLFLSHSLPLLSSTKHSAKPLKNLQVQKLAKSQRSTRIENNKSWKQKQSEKNRETHNHTFTHLIKNKFSRAQTPRLKWGEVQKPQEHTFNPKHEKPELPLFLVKSTKVKTGNGGVRCLNKHC